MVADTVQSRRADTLVALLNEIADAHERLLDVIEEKIQAMRKADTAAINAAVERERELVGFINDREGLRRQLTENIARSYGIGGPAARKLSARQLAKRMGAEADPKMDEATARLRDITARIARRNHTAAMISENVLRHVKHVFAAMTGADGTRSSYSSAGAVTAGAAHRIFDAVG